jgi:hypothetical protein
MPCGCGEAETRIGDFNETVEVPPLPQVSDEQIGQIVRYVRELQQANGIVYRKHQM